MDANESHQVDQVLAQIGVRRTSDWVHDTEPFCNAQLADALWGDLRITARAYTAEHSYTRHLWIVVRAYNARYMPALALYGDTGPDFNTWDVRLKR